MNDDGADLAEPTVQQSQRSAPFLDSSPAKAVPMGGQQHVPPQRPADATSGASTPEDPTDAFNGGYFSVAAPDGDGSHGDDGGLAAMTPPLPGSQPPPGPHHAKRKKHLVSKRGGGGGAISPRSRSPERSPQPPATTLAHRRQSIESITLSAVSEHSPPRSEGDESARDLALRAALQACEEEYESDREHPRTKGSARPRAPFIKPLTAPVVAKSSSSKPHPATPPKDKKAAAGAATKKGAGGGGGRPVGRGGRPSAFDTRLNSMMEALLDGEEGADALLASFRIEAERAAAQVKTDAATKSVPSPVKRQRPPPVLSKAARLQQRAMSVVTPDDWVALRARDYFLRQTFDTIFEAILEYNRTALSQHQIRIPAPFIDPVSKTLIVDPVHHIDGTSMDRRSASALQFRLMAQLAWTERQAPEAGRLAWFERGSTRSFYRHFVQQPLRPNRLLRLEIVDWVNRILGVFSNVRDVIDRQLDAVRPFFTTDKFRELLPSELLALEMVKGALWDPSGPADSGPAPSGELLEIIAPADASAAAVFADLWDFTIDVARETAGHVFAASSSRDRALRVARHSVCDHSGAIREEEGTQEVFLGGRRDKRRKQKKTFVETEFWNVVVKAEFDARKRLVTAHEAVLHGYRGRLEIALLTIRASASRRQSSLFSRSVGEASVCRGGESPARQMLLSASNTSGTYEPTRLRTPSSPTSAAAITPSGSAAFQPPHPASEYPIPALAQGGAPDDASLSAASSASIASASGFQSTSVRNDQEEEAEEDDLGFVEIVTLTLPEPTRYTADTTAHTIAATREAARGGVTILDAAALAASGGDAAARSVRLHSCLPTHELFSDDDDLHLSDVIALTAAGLGSNIIQKRFVESGVDLWLDVAFDVKMRRYNDYAARRTGRLAKLWLLHNSTEGGTEALLGVDPLFFETSVLGPSARQLDGKGALVLPVCEVASLNPPETFAGSSINQTATGGGGGATTTAAAATHPCTPPRPVSNRNNKPKAAATPAWRPLPATPPASASRRPPARPPPSDGATATAMQPTEAWLAKAMPKPPREPRVLPAPSSCSLAWRAKVSWPLPSGDTVGHAPDPKPFTVDFNRSVDQLLETVHSHHLAKRRDWSSSEEESGDDGCKDDAHDGLATLTNFLRATNAMPKGKMRDDDEQRLQDERLRIIKDLIGSGVRKFAAHKKRLRAADEGTNSEIPYATPLLVSGDGCGDTLHHLQTRDPARFPLDLVRELVAPIATPSDAMLEASVIDAEFPTSYLLRELGHRYEQYDARVAADRAAWLQANGFTAAFKQFEHPDETARRLARREAQVIAEVSASTLGHLKRLWEGCGTGFQSPCSLLSNAVVVAPTTTTTTTSISGAHAVKFAAAAAPLPAAAASPVRPPPPRLPSPTRVTFSLPVQTSKPVRPAAATGPPAQPFVMPSLGNPKSGGGGGAGGSGSRRPYATGAPMPARGALMANLEDRLRLVPAVNRL